VVQKVAVDVVIGKYHTHESVNTLSSVAVDILKASHQQITQKSIQAVAQNVANLNHLSNVDRISQGTLHLGSFDQAVANHLPGFHTVTTPPQVAPPAITNVADHVQSLVSHPGFWSNPHVWLGIAATVLLTAAIVWLVRRYGFYLRRWLLPIVAFIVLIFGLGNPPSVLKTSKSPSSSNSSGITPVVGPPSKLPAAVPASAKHKRVRRLKLKPITPLPSYTTLELAELPAPPPPPLPNVATVSNPEEQTTAVEAKSYVDRLLADSEAAAERDVLEDLELEAAASAVPSTPRVTVTASFQQSNQFVTTGPDTIRLGPALDGTFIPKTGGPSKKTTQKLRDTEKDERQSRARLATAVKKHLLAQAIVDWVEASRNGDIFEDARSRLTELAPEANLTLLTALSNEDLENLRAVAQAQDSTSHARESALRVARELLQTQANAEQGWQFLFRWYLGFNVLNPTVDPLNLARWGIQLPQVSLAPKIDWRAQALRLKSELEHHQTETAGSDDPAAFRQALADLLPWVDSLERQLDKKAHGGKAERQRQKPYRDTLTALRALASGEEPVYPNLEGSDGPNLKKKIKRLALASTTRLSDHGSETMSNLDASNNVTKTDAAQTVGETLGVTIDASHAAPSTGNTLVDRALELQRQVNSPKIFAFNFAQMFSLDNPEGAGAYTRTILSLDVTRWIQPAIDQVLHLFAHPGEAKARAARQALADAAVQQARLAAKLSNDKTLSPLEKADLQVELAKSRLDVTERLAPYGSRWIDLSYLLYGVINSTPDKHDNRTWADTGGLSLTGVFNPAKRLDEKAVIAGQIATARQEVANAERGRIAVLASEERSRWTASGEEALRHLEASVSDPSIPLNFHAGSWTLNLYTSDNVSRTIEAVVNARFPTRGIPSGAGLLRRIGPQTGTVFFGDATGDYLRTRGETVNAGQVTLLGGTAQANARASRAEKRLQAKQTGEAKQDLSRKLQSLFDRVAGLHKQALIEQEEYNAALKNWRANSTAPDRKAQAIQRLSAAVERLYGVMGRLAEANKILGGELNGLDTRGLGLRADLFSLDVQEIQATVSVNEPDHAEASAIPDWVLFEFKGLKHLFIYKPATRGLFTAA
jgi:hypothetical protein